jgi:predicted DNA-binding protein
MLPTVSEQPGGQRNVARPRKGEEKHRPIHLGFKVTEELNNDLRRLAERRGSPMSDVVVEILEKGLREALAKKAGR